MPATARSKARPSASRTWGMKLKAPLPNFWIRSTTFWKSCERYSFLHREHLVTAASQDYAEKWRADFVEDRERKPNRKHEGPDGARDDPGGREGWTIEARRLRGRIYRREHRRVAIAGLRR